MTDPCLLELSQDPETSSLLITEALYRKKNPRILQSWIEDRSQVLGKEGADDVARARKLGQELFEQFHPKGTPLSKETRSLRKWGSQIAVVPAEYPQGISVGELTALGIDKPAKQLAKLGLRFAKVGLRSSLNRERED